MATYIYNCKRCRRGRRVEYPLGSAKRGFSRMDASGSVLPGGIWIQACGGGPPTIYGGDLENGICSDCQKMMSFGELKAIFRPDHKCDARCTSARGHHCECSCGGANHGIAA